MTKQTQPRTREPRPLRSASRKSSTAEPHAARFDAQRCYERYIASHHDPDSAGIFPGVPFH